MKNILNYISLVIGSLLMLSGIIKLVGGTINLNIGNYIEGTSFIYILLVNFLCGASIILHAIFTLKKSDDNPVVSDMKMNIIFISAIIMITHGIFRLLEIVIMLSGISLDELNSFVTLIIISMLINCIIPPILAAKNLKK